MPGQMSQFKGTLERVQEESSRQEELNKIKEELATKNIGEITDAYRELYDRKEKLKKEESDVQLMLDAHAQLLVDNLETAGLSQIRTNDGSTTLFIKDDVYCQQQNRGDYIRWIKETGQEDLLTVHSSTMSAMTKDRLQKGLPTPPGIKAFFKQTINIRRNKV